MFLLKREFPISLFWATRGAKCPTREFSRGTAPAGIERPKVSNAWPLEGYRAVAISPGGPEKSCGRRSICPGGSPKKRK